MNLPLVQVVTILFIFTMSCNNSNEEGNNAAPQRLAIPIKTWDIISAIRHDTSYFTQGYEFYNGTLLIGTGNYGQSRLLKVEPSSGKIIQQVKLNDKQFGEGLTVLNDTIYQLTWKEHIVHIYNAKDLKKIREAVLPTEGWGATNDGSHLIISNGSNQLFYYEPRGMTLIKKISVTEAGVPAVNLNELEYAEGYIYANQWQYNYVLKIDPSTGDVVAKYDFTEMVRNIEAQYPYLDVKNNAVLNGIAYEPTTKRFYITGKSWPLSFEVEMTP
jgi:glutaminyl-peptide cyclotransferase